MEKENLKFRAWDKKDKIMYFDIQKGIEFTDLSHYTFDEFLGNKKGMGDYHEWEVMQSTGLKDKNGKEIYESDIVKIGNKKHNDSTDIAEIRWYRGGFMMFLIGYFGGRNIEMFDRDCEKHKIIGNIYENEELIG